PWLYSHLRSPPGSPWSGRDFAIDTVGIPSLSQTTVWARAAVAPVKATARAQRMILKIPTPAFIADSTIMADCYAYMTRSGASHRAADATANPSKKWAIATPAPTPSFSDVTNS